MTQSVFPQKNLFGPGFLPLLSMLLLVLMSCASVAEAGGNTRNESFSAAKKMLKKQVYTDHKVTIYCEAAFDDRGNIRLPEGFTTEKHVKRQDQLEWEHIVPAENFGRTFEEWREGSAQCIDNNGKRFKGRKCAEKVNREYRYMQSDMYNLYPAIGAVNAMRQNYSFQMLPEAPVVFGSCAMKIEEGKVEPPVRARGVIARTYKYMQDAYPRYRMSRGQQQLMDAWDTMYPVDQWECTRAKRIEQLQGNTNTFVETPCRENGLW